jgi:hypothetical protein
MKKIKCPHLEHGPHLAHDTKPELIFLKNSDLKPDLIVINLKKQMSLIQFQFPSGFKC